jgi:acetyl-CoA carboxylase biotin carboxylase subunit
MRRALDEFIIGGIRSNIPLQKRLLDLPEVRDGSMTTRTVENLMAADALARARN